MLVDAISEEICHSSAAVWCRGRWGRERNECKRNFAVGDSGRGSTGRRWGGYILQHGGDLRFFFSGAALFGGQDTRKNKEESKIVSVP
jgi:hypothetical protein